MRVMQLCILCVLKIHQLMVYTGFSNASVPSACYSLATCLPLNIWKSALFKRANQHFWKTHKQTQMHANAHTHTHQQFGNTAHLHAPEQAMRANTHTHTHTLKVTLWWLEMPFMQIEYKPSADQNLALNLICNWKKQCHSSWARAPVNPHSCQPKAKQLTIILFVTYSICECISVFLSLYH